MISPSKAGAVIVDAHHHFWNPARFPQTWMTDEHDAIARRFEPTELEPLLRLSGVTATVVVQSAADDRDTDYLFEQTGRAPWVGAVVAWLRLDDERTARNRLADLQARPRFRGVRHLINLETDPHWILDPRVEAGLQLLEDADVLLELPAEFPNHLEDVPELARRHPGLSIVIDHLGKPPLGRESIRVWRRQLAAAAEHANVHAKVSGLGSGEGSSDPRTAIETAFESFGPDRLMFGSDWPMALLHGTYENLVGEMRDAIELIAGGDAEAVLAANALRLYRIGATALSKWDGT